LQAKPSGAPLPPRRIVVPLPLPIRTANAWLFAGRAPALVDCGIATPEGTAALLAGLREGGVAPGAVTVLLTHGHMDHAGNVAMLREAGARVAAAPAEAPYLETFRADQPRRLDAFARALRAHGAPEVVVEASRERALRLDACMHDAPLDIPLKDGQHVSLGDTQATVHFAPGHTQGSALYATDDNALLSGDTLLEHITSNAVELLDRDKGRYRQYLRTLEGLRRFAGCTVYPGHGDPFALTDELLDAHDAKHRRRAERVLERLDRPKTAWQLLGEVLPHLAHGQEFLGMCEVVGHLHMLELEGKVAWSADASGVRRFRRS
jgi:glyoxylase-like metal-dependent hydrolase (beta-lactamase superfamily II)